MSRKIVLSLACRVGTCVALLIAVPLSVIGQSPCTPLTSFEDWPALVFGGKHIGTGSSNLQAPSGDVPEIGWQTLHDARPQWADEEEFRVPKAEISVSQSTEWSATVFFDGSASYDEDGTVVDWQWDFGDGTTGSGVNVTHTYTRADTHHVALIVRDDQGNENSWPCGETVAVATDLSIVHSSSASVVAAGADVSYSVTVTNNGPLPVGVFTIQANLPLETRYVSCSGVAECGGGTESTRVARIEAMQPGAVVTITFAAKVDCWAAHGTTVTSSATIRSPTADFNEADNAAETSVLVQNAPPGMTTCPPERIVPVGSSCQAPLADLRPEVTTSDTCGTVQIAQSPAPGTPLGLGDHTITLTATDANGIATTCTVLLRVVETTPPPLTCAGNIVTNANANLCSAVVSYAVPTATDNCSLPL
jgi:uncharacterized repeat protein (TIGR01451 family)